MNYWVYMMASQSRVLYTGITNNLERRVSQHKCRSTQGFTSRYSIRKLVYFEETPDVLSAIAREKQIKGWIRKKKIALIEDSNPGWADLSDGWYA